MMNEETNEGFLTELQGAFMWMNRAVFEPERISLPDD